VFIYIYIYVISIYLRILISHSHLSNIIFIILNHKKKLFIHLLILYLFINSLLIKYTSLISYKYFLLLFSHTYYSIQHTLIKSSSISIIITHFTKNTNHIPQLSHYSYYYLLLINTYQISYFLCSFSMIIMIPIYIILWECLN
jgi:hypothetical protein